MKPFTLYQSSNSNKKYDVYVPTRTGFKKVSYGSKGMSDYTIHHDKERRDQYRSRHRHDHIYDPYKAGFWAWHHLWGNSPVSSIAFKNAVDLAKTIL